MRIIWICILLFYVGARAAFGDQELVVSSLRDAMKEYNATLCEDSQFMVLAGISKLQCIRMVNESSNFCAEHILQVGRMLNPSDEEGVFHAIQSMGVLYSTCLRSALYEEILGQNLMK